MSDRLDEIKKKLEKYNQKHLLMFYDKMSEEEKKELLNKIENIDFELMQDLYKKYHTANHLF